jgi:hypothetical protein
VDQAVIAIPARLAPLLALLLVAPAAYAHVLDEYLQATLVEIEPDGIKLQINLTPGVQVAEPIIARIDADHDDAISTQEAARYCDMLKRDLAVRLDGRDVEPKLTASNFPDPDELRSGWEVIQTEFSIKPGSLGAGQHRLVFENRHAPSAGVYLFNAAKPKSDRVRITGQRRNEDQSQGEIEFVYQPPANSPPTGIFIGGVTAAFAALSAGVWRVRRLRLPFPRRLS